MNLAEQSPVREEEEKWAHDPILRGIEAAGKIKRNEIINRKRREGSGKPVETTINAREFAVPPEN